MSWNFQCSIEIFWEPEWMGCLAPCLFCKKPQEAESSISDVCATSQPIWPLETFWTKRACSTNRRKWFSQRDWKIFLDGNILRIFVENVHKCWTVWDTENEREIVLEESKNARWNQRNLGIEEKNNQSKSKCFQMLSEVDLWSEIGAQSRLRRIGGVSPHCPGWNAPPQYILHAFQKLKKLLLIWKFLKLSIISCPHDLNFFCEIGIFLIVNMGG